VAFFLPLARSTIAPTGRGAWEKQIAMKTTWMVWAAAVMTAAAMIPLGCSSVSVDPEAEGCPGAAPKEGATCSVAATGCAYDAGPCAVEMSCKAAGEAWTSETKSCSPAAKDCWAAGEGDSCADVNDSCGEADGPCGSGFATTCGADHRWHVESITGDCPPPVPADKCQANETKPVCEAAEGCRWLTPGCDQGVTTVTGCFTAVDCTSGGCGPEAECMTVSYNPCFEKACDACAASAAICYAL
jgi:hypothetical protein